MTAPTAKAEWALDQVRFAMDAGFTGSLVFDFKDGVPMIVKQTETRRFDDDGGGRRLTGR